MANDSKKVSELTIATALSANDRVVVLTSPNTSGIAVKTITLNNISNSIISYIPSSVKVPTTNTEYIGYVLSTNSTGIAAWSPFTGVNYVTSITTANTYTVTSNDSVLLVNPYVVGSNVTITLPIEGAIEGKEILVKNLDSTGNKTVRITTDDVGNAYLEDPVTGSFVTYYDLVDSGQAETWIHDGNVYRHLNTARATPIFYTNANTYAQVVIKNASAGNNASADLALYNNLSNNIAGTGPYIDIGIESSTYSNSLYTLYGPSDGYVYVDNNGNPGGNLIIGTAGDRSIVFHANGTNTDKKVLTVNSTSITLATVLQAPQTTKANSSIGTAGQICWDGSYIYVCTATNTWKRATLNTF